LGDERIGAAACSQRTRAWEIAGTSISSYIDIQHRIERNARASIRARSAQNDRGAGARATAIGAGSARQDAGYESISRTSGSKRGRSGKVARVGPAGYVCV